MSDKTDREERAARIEHFTKKFYDFQADDRYPFKDRLLAYLLTPKIYATSYSSIPKFMRFEADYGKIDWEKEFPYLKPEQSVNLQFIIDVLVTKGNKTFFPAHWTDDAIFLFVQDAVEMACHEFDMYEEIVQYQYEG